jgi:1A family penicillin-binding protein
MLQLRQRFHELRQRFQAPSAEPARVWIRRDWWKVSLVAIGVVAVLALNGWLLTCGFAGCPSSAALRAYRPSEGGRIFDQNGKQIGNLAIVRRINVPLDRIPKHVRQAFVATEDRRFFKHDGVDWRGFARSIVRNVKAGGVREGASTITMQVARNSYLLQRYHGRSLRRKLIELRLARLLEGELTKEQLLEHYMNVIYLGNGVYGVEAASKDLFGKSVSQVSLSEAALLAALPKAPTYYTPREHPKRAVERRNLVLRLMHEQGWIDEANFKRSSAVPLRIAQNEWRPSQYDQYGAVDAIRAFVDSVLPDALKEGDILVHTTIDARAQAAADKAIARHAVAIQNQGWGRGQQLQGALVALDPNSGDIRALVGGRRARRGGFIRATDAKRQPGSAFKPFVYAAAFAAGLSPASIVDDEPIEVMIGNTPWIPANYDDNYQGRTTLRRALMVSANAATVRVSRVVGEQNVIAAARRNGIVSDMQPHPSLALGALEVTPIELVTAYAPFANGGIRVQPRLVTRIEAPDGKVLWSVEVQRAQVMDPRDAYQVTSMLRGAVDYGTGRVIRDYGITGPVAGKTGTTNSGNDVWFVGYTPSIVAGVWFGYDTPQPIADRAAGGRFAAPAWVDFYKTGWRERATDWLPPDGMVSAIIDPESGELATEYCPRKVREWFKPGSQPQTQCEMHLYPEPAIVADDGTVMPNAQNGDWLNDLGRKLKRILRF